ncbi:MAG: IS66 family transposase [Desulfobacterales bacterium]|nr:MAG: IS66 family transposase [Desulfobacterales bacterium]
MPKDIVLSLVNEIQVKHNEIEVKYQEKIHYLEEQLRLFKNELFGRSSEKRHEPHPDQRPLFNGDDNHVAGNIQANDDTVVIAAHTRKKRGRKPLPKDLPRIDIIHDLSEDEKQCACGARLTRFGEEVCEKLDYIPARLRVERHIRYKYACKSCEGVEDDGPTVRIAPAPVQLIPKSNATAGLLAHIAVSKFADAVPLYRQQKIFDRLGIEMSRAVMAKWLVQAARSCAGLIDLLREEIRSGPLINIDESPLQVLNEAGRRNTSKSYMWVYGGGQPDRAVLLYQYHRTRSGRKALEFLDDYHGYIQSDDFAGYDHLDQKPDIVHLGCWAHARRKFVKVVKVRKKHRSKRVNPKSLADEALDYIGNLYRIEKEAQRRELDAVQIYQLRQEKSKPLLDEFKDWLEAKKPLTPPKGLLGQAISYTLANWKKLIIYIQDGRLRPDNNLVENAIRPFVVGRKNWLFAGSPDGAKASATFFTLIETAKTNGLEPYTYLRYIFEKLPLAQTEQDLKDLLPQNIDPDSIAVSN